MILIHDQESLNIVTEAALNGKGVSGVNHALLNHSECKYLSLADIPLFQSIELIEY